VITAGAVLVLVVGLAAIEAYGIRRSNQLTDSGRDSAPADRGRDRRVPAPSPVRGRDSSTTQRGA
jgi:hypothetical protein